MNNDELLGLLAKLYLELLKLPLGSMSRVDADRSLAGLRDAIAVFMATEPELVQNSFELVARALQDA